METVNQLKIIQADLFTFFMKAWFFHWNVEGKDFIQLHEFFGSIYNDLLEPIDATAEHIRSLEKYAPGSYSRFQQLSNVKEETKVPYANMMISFLLNDNEIIIHDLRRAIEVSKSDNLEEITNFLSGMLEYHSKLAWKLKSLLRNHSSESR